MIKQMGYNYFMMDQKELLDFLRRYNREKLPDGLRFVGLFGSFARGMQDRYSDVDITYHMDHEILYKDNAFKKLILLEDIKKELESILHRKVDLVPDNVNDSVIARRIAEEKIIL